MLLVEGTAVIRSTVAAYLRECGFRVLEAADSNEALTVLENGGFEVHVVVVDAAVAGAHNGFQLARWLKTNRPEIKTILSGTPERAAQAATTLCDDGPGSSQPHTPHSLHQEIRRLLATEGNQNSLSSSLMSETSPNPKLRVIR